MRVFAGPNGSGKTTIIEDLRKKNLFHFNVYINADDIEKLIRNNRSLDLAEYQIKSDTKEIRSYFRKSKFSQTILNDPNVYEMINIQDNTVYFNLQPDTKDKYYSYIAADIASFIRKKLFEGNKSFSFETVMSHNSKIELMKKAKEKGYRVYLYYVSTEAPEININRVEIRKAQDGHNVPEKKIKERYKRSLNNLKSAVLHTYRSYIFDNSGEVSKLVAEINKGEGKIIDPENTPNWVIKYLLNN